MEAGRMKKYSLFIITDKNPLPRLCDFVITGENILGVELKSETIRGWIRKGKIKKAIAENIALLQSDFETFHEK
jgi:predicted AAA+ superfamily ATPase